MNRETGNGRSALRSPASAGLLAVRGAALAAALCAAFAVHFAAGAEPAPGQPPQPIPMTVPVPEEATHDQAASAFDRELRTVEEGVGNLKERVFSSKATLEMLKELVIEGVATGSRVSIVHVNHVGGAYSVESMQYWIDQRSVFNKSDPNGALDELTETEVYQGNVKPGTHTIQIAFGLRGKGYKVFSYLRAWQFRLQDTHEFIVEEGMTKTIRVIAGARSGFQRYQDRPNIEYVETTGSLE
jgi:hypothetical protein